MPNQFEIALVLQRDLPTFQSALARGLRLDVDDQHELETIDWRLWTPWTVATFGGDEFAKAVDARDISVRSLSERGRALLGGEVQLNDAAYINPQSGELAQRARELGDKKDPDSQECFDTVTTARARFLVTSCALVGANTQEWSEQVPSIPQTRIDAEPGKSGLRIRFPGNEFKYPLHRNPETVVTFGPGLTGNIFVGDMLGRTENVHLVSGGNNAMFLRKWNQGQLVPMAAGVENFRRTGELAAWVPDVPVDQIRLPETFYYDDGIAASIGMIASRTIKRGKPVDVVVMSAVHSAGRREVEAGVDGAHQLLVDGGLLVVKAPRISIGDEGGMDVTAGRAMPLFGNPIAAGEAGQLRQHKDSTLPLERPADFAIFQKS